MRELVENIFEAIDQDRLPPVCFVNCSDREFAEECALSCAARYCQFEEITKFPDFFDLSCPVSVAELRELLSELAKRSFSEGKRCVRMRNAELLSEQEQNILLKILEEPPQRTLFLLCGNLSAMLPTVRSRCAVLRLGSPSPAQFEDMLLSRGASPQDAKLYSSVSTSFAQAMTLCSEGEARALRLSSFEAYLSLLNASPPYSFIKDIRSQRGAAAQIIAYWLSFTGDLLACKYALPPQNRDLEKRLYVYAARFTSERINCMIEMLTAAFSRLQTNVSPGATLDYLATQMLEDNI